MTGETKEYGVTGLRMSSGRMQEEFLPELRWPDAIRVYREMMDNEPVVGALLFAIEMLIRGVSWKVTPYSDSAKHKREAEILEECLHDMEKPWSEVVNDFLTFIPLGFSVHEMVFKLRRGPSSSPKFNSKYSDGLYGFRKMPSRAQWTIDKWDRDDNGNLKGVWQINPNSFNKPWIPESKLLLFRVNSKYDNPEGRSILRNAYRPWYFKKTLEEIEATGISKDMNGLPLFYVPARILSDSASEEEKKLRADLENILTNLHKNEQEGLILPAMFNESGERLFSFELVTSGSTRQFDISASVNRYANQIAMVALADFIMLGHQSSGGSFALSSNKSKMFTAAIGAFLGSIKGVFNQKAVGKLGALNGWEPNELPSLDHESLEGLDLAVIGKYFSDLGKSGVIPPSKELSDFLHGLGTRGEVTEGGSDLGDIATDAGKPTGDARIS